MMLPAGGMAGRVAGRMVWWGATRSTVSSCSPTAAQLPRTLLPAPRAMLSSSPTGRWAHADTRMWNSFFGMRVCLGGRVCVEHVTCFADSSLHACWFFRFLGLQLPHPAPRQLQQRWVPVLPLHQVQEQEQEREQEQEQGRGQGRGWVPQHPVDAVTGSTSCLWLGRWCLWAAPSTLITSSRTTLRCGAGGVACSLCLLVMTVHLGPG